MSSWDRFKNTKVEELGVGERESASKSSWSGLPGVESKDTAGRKEQTQSQPVKKKWVTGDRHEAR